MATLWALLAVLLMCQLLSYGGHQELTNIFYTLPDTGQPPVLVSLADNAKLELRHPEEHLFANDSEEQNDTKIFSIIDGDTILDETEKLSEDLEKKKESTEPRLIVKAKPAYETRQVEEAFQTPSVEQDAVIESQADEPKEQEAENIPVKPDTPQEDMPSFSEWAQKQLAEADKKVTVLNHSSQSSHSNTNFSSKSTKLRSKNYASLACGAKVVAVNPEAGSASFILTPNKDEYMLNTCNIRVWFIVELCEAVQAQKIEIANFELFSSTHKDIAVYFSDRFPTRDWASVGQFTLQDTRDVQSFDLYPHLFGKFIKVEMLSHHGSEHYCPISLFKVYGTSEFEVLEKENSQHPTHIDEDEDDDIIDMADEPAADTQPSRNLFDSARDAVMSIMKKAAQALVKSDVPKNAPSVHNATSTDKMYKRCCSPSHIIVCDNCSETLYHEVFELISCNSDKLVSLVRQVFLRDTLKCTDICQPYGLHFKSTKAIEFSDERVAYINALFPRKYIAALCNILAIKEKKVVLNTSFENELNETLNVTVEQSPQTINSETNVEQEIKLVPDKNTTSNDNENNITMESEEKTTIETMIEGTTVPIEVPNEQTELTDENIEETATIEDKLVQESHEVQPEIEKDTESITDTDKDGNQKSEVKNVKMDITVEKSKENNGLDEVTDQITMDNYNFISDFDQMAVDPTPPGMQASQNQNQPQTTLQKESVFLRLSNRVKTLERNMSLSSQYLEELSRRYKKQVEEMQKLALQMADERRKCSESEQELLDYMNTLREQVSQMTESMNVLLDERNSWFGDVNIFKFVIFISIITAIVFYIMSKRAKPVPILIPIPKKIKKKQDKFRRKSVEGVSGHATPSAKKRRPSEEALQITRQSTDEISKDQDSGEWQVARKNRRRKTSIIHRNVEVELSQGWSRQDSLNKLQDNPIVLDEEEFYSPVTEPKVFNEIDISLAKRNIPKTNGSFFNSLKNKTMKTRRLSSPAFLRTLSRQSSRSTPSPVVTTLEPVFNGDMSKKESPTGSLWSDSTVISAPNQNHQESNSGKKRKSLKNILKKVF